MPERHLCLAVVCDEHLPRVHHDHLRLHHRQALGERLLGHSTGDRVDPGVLLLCVCRRRAGLWLVQAHHEPTLKEPGVPGVHGAGGSGGLRVGNALPRVGQARSKEMLANESEEELEARS